MSNQVYFVFLNRLFSVWLSNNSYLKTYLHVSPHHTLELHLATMEPTLKMHSLPSFLSFFLSSSLYFFLSVFLFLGPLEKNQRG